MNFKANAIWACIITVFFISVSAYAAEIQISETERYVGDVNQANQPNGNGILYKNEYTILGWVEDSIYEGEWYNGQMTGFGKKRRIDAFGQRDYLSGFFKKGNLFIDVSRGFYTDQNGNRQYGDIIEDRNNQYKVFSREALILFVDVPYIAKNYELTKINVAPTIVNDTTLVPVRIITEQMGGNVQWNGQTSEVSLDLDGRNIKMNIGNTTALVDGEAINMPVAPTIINGSTMIPIRFVSEQMYLTVNWIQGYSAVEILMPEG